MIAKPLLRDNYKRWPFSADLENGRTNIGAINLTKEPERISEIHELSHTPKLRKAIYLINKESSAFMTLGCLIEKDPEKDMFWAYLEFCFRPTIDTSGIDLWKIDEEFFKYVAERNGEAAAKQLADHLSWEAFEIELYGSTPCLAYSVFYPHPRVEEVEAFYTYLLNWLRQSFDHLAS